jgi:membrane-bound lytic murein transglycosylase A
MKPTAPACGVVAALVAATMALAAPPAPPDVHMQPLLFEALHGWANDDHAAAFGPFRRSCAALNAKPAPARPALPSDMSLQPACAAALALARPPTKKEARAFFENWFVPALVGPAGEAFYTGYYEPEYNGSLTRTKIYNTPLLGYPPGPPPDPFPDRAAIEGGVFSGRGLELVWLEPVDAFFVHIQGSARIKLPDGKTLRVNFAGRNGHPFTPIGRVLVERGTMTRERADATSIRAYLAANPLDAPALMRENKSYIFFRVDEGRPDQEGPIGAQTVPVSAGRSIAVDDGIWPYGLPVWIEARLPAQKGELLMQRLMIAQDTGAAIRGPARADIFIGTGPEAGKIAGRIRHRGHFIVLMPRPVPAQ